MITIRFYKVADDYGWLSNFAPYPFVLDGKKWPTVEHYFQAQKFGNKKYQEEIRNSRKAVLAARMGRDRRHKLRDDWESVKVSIMKKAVKAKFSQNSHLGKMLVATKNALLIEHTIRDAFWGDGGDGHGQNMLGRLLMEVREKLNEH